MNDELGKLLAEMVKLPKSELSKSDSDELEQPTRKLRDKLRKLNEMGKLLAELPKSELSKLPESDELSDLDELIKLSKLSKLPDLPESELPKLPKSDESDELEWGERYEHDHSTLNRYMWDKNYWLEYANREKKRIEKEKVEVERKKAEKEKAEAEKTAVGHPSLRVLSALPSPAIDKDHKALIERYSKLYEEKTPLSLLPDADNVATLLSAEFPWMTNIIDIIHADLTLAASCGAGHVHLSPLLLVGGAGVGKSRFAYRLAAALGGAAACVNAGGSSDNRALMGTARGYSTATPCLPLVAMANFKTANPLIIIDEIDKVTMDSRNGNIAETLLSMTEPVTSRSWVDECLMVPADLSQVTWVLLANRLDKVNPLLRSRCRVMTVSAPRPQDFDTLLSGILADIATDFGAKPWALPALEPEIIDALRRGFRKGHLQVRQLAKLVKRALTAAAMSERQMMRH